jgi:transposase InsO family protein
VKKVCEVLGKSRDSYYKRFRREENRLEGEDSVLELVCSVRQEEPRTGTRKLHHRISADLKRRGVSIGRDRLFEFLKKHSMLVRPKRRFERTTYSNHNYVVAPNRLKKTPIKSPNEALVSDITYLRLKGGFAYLFLVTDAYSRKIMGYHLSKDLSHYSAILSLQMAISSLPYSRGVLHHSDRGCQYCCHDFLNFLGEHGIVPSMTDESHCYQNAIAKRVNGILKDEFNLDSIFLTLGEAQAAVARAVWVYNNKRNHWSLALKTPAEVHSEAA